VEKVKAARINFALAQRELKVGEPSGVLLYASLSVGRPPFVSSLADFASDCLPSRLANGRPSRPVELAAVCWSWSRVEARPFEGREVASGRVPPPSGKESSSDS